jgi:hypothetical protein
LVVGLVHELNIPRFGDEVKGVNRPKGYG